MGLQESMRRFDSTRGNAVAIGAAVEHPPLGLELAAETSKGTLH
jgi:hypothetical protein